MTAVGHPAAMHVARRGDIAALAAEKSFRPAICSSRSARVHVALRRRLAALAQRHIAHQKCDGEEQHAQRQQAAPAPLRLLGRGDQIVTLALVDCVRCSERSRVSRCRAAALL